MVEGIRVVQELDLVQVKAEPNRLKEQGILSTLWRCCIPTHILSTERQIGESPQERILGYPFFKTSTMIVLEVLSAAADFLTLLSRHILTSISSSLKVVGKSKVTAGFEL